MARTDEALEVLQKADGPLTAKEVFERSNEFQGAAEACWAINTLMKSGKVIAVGKKPQDKGPDRIAYAVADGKTRAAGPAPKPKPQATRPVAKPKPAQASARPSAKSPQAAAESKSAPDMRDENAPPPGHIGADEQPFMAIDSAGWLRIGPYMFTPVQAAQIGRFLENVSSVWECHVE